jgi:hypothetical protein
MAPNAKTRLLYENDDVERVGAFEKKGKNHKRGTCPSHAESCIVGFRSNVCPL